MNKSEITETLCPSVVPEVEGGCVDDDITGQGEGLCCEQHSQRQIQRSEKHNNVTTVRKEKKK